MTTVEQPPARFRDIPAAAFLQARAVPLELPCELAGNRARDTVFQARFARTPGGSELRTVHIHGPRIEIINLFLFPPAASALPLYAMEFVLFGQKPVVCVMDARPLSGHPWAVELWSSGMREAHNLHPELTDAGDPPHWYSECRSGLDFFCRPEHPALLEKAVACHEGILGALLAEEPSAPGLDPHAASAHHDALAAYKDHHRENSPGLPFLNRSFGPDWTRRFLSDALFA